MTVKLQRLRAERGFTGEDLAKEAGLHIVYIRKIETGGYIPSKKAQQKIADVIGYDGDPAELFVADPEWEHDKKKARKVMMMRKLQRELAGMEGDWLADKTGS